MSVGPESRSPEPQRRVHTTKKKNTSPSVDETISTLPPEVVRDPTNPTLATNQSTNLPTYLPTGTEGTQGSAGSATQSHSMPPSPYTGLVARALKELRPGPRASDFFFPAHSVQVFSPQIQQLGSFLFSCPA